MAHLQRQVSRCVRVVVVVVSVVALSSRAVQAQTSVTPPHSSVQWPPDVSMASPRLSGLPVPIGFRSGELSEPVLQRSTTTSHSGGSHKIVAGIAGAFIGGVFGTPIGEWMNRNSHSGDRATKGGMIGFSVGAVVGAIVVVRLAR
jgi:hypothetical protein